jgi:hypothetical protein
MRTIVDLTEEQRAWLEAESRREGISRAETIRRLVEEARRRDRRSRLKAALEAAAGSWTAGDGLEYQLRIRAEWDREWDPD